MLFSESMELFNVVVFKEHSESVVQHLLKLGLYHPVDIRHVEKQMQRLSPFEIQKESGDYDAIEGKLRELFRKFNIKGELLQDVAPLALDDMRKIIAQIHDDAEPLINKKNDLSEELKAKETLLAHVQEYFSFPIEKKAYYSFLEVAVGMIEEKNIPILSKSLKDIPHLIYPFRKDNTFYTLVIGLRRDKAYLEKVFRDLAWEDVDFSQKPESLSKEAQLKLALQVEEIKKNIEAVNQDIKQFAQKTQEKLSHMYTFIALKKALLEAKRYSYLTEKTVLISGWIPQSQKQRIIKEIKTIDPSVCIEDKKPEELNIPKDEIPVSLTHNRFLKPFELLIDSYGLPRYGTIDPTLFVAITFLIMFGAMFGDLGHGLVLILLAFLLGRSKNKTVKQASALLVYCGMSSALFGFLYGSICGYEFHSVIKPIEKILDVFKISVIFGVGVISLGIVINVINAFRDRNYAKAVFDKAGLIAGIFYWAGIAFVIKLFMGKNVFPFFYFNLIIVCLAILFLKPIIATLLKHHREEGLFVTFMESSIDILEIIMGYLANTVSYIRVAAFALAHAGLFIAIFELSKLLKGVGEGFFSLLVIILGNILVICLEGLVVSIQSLRLTYYEFFSKFFIMSKQAYKPLTLGANQ